MGWSDIEGFAADRPDRKSPRTLQTAIDSFKGLPDFSQPRETGLNNNKQQQITNNNNNNNNIGIVPNSDATYYGGVSTVGRDHMSENVALPRLLPPTTSSLGQRTTSRPFLNLVEHP